jgi:hypothetical protein
MVAKRNDEKIRPSRVIMTFGPGALLDTENRANYMVLGPESWYAHRPIREHRLARSLDVDLFGEPATAIIGLPPRRVGLAVSRFPRIRYCPSCKLLTPDLNCQDGTPPNGAKHKPGEVPTIGPRLVAACTRGHIQDFPWGGWVAAKGGHKSCTCAHGAQRLRLTGGGLDAENSDLAVQCDVCDGRRSLEGALKPLRFTCGGYRPWDRSRNQEPCDQPLRGLMRGASNVYFPIPVSSLDIPPFSRQIVRDLRRFVVDGTRLQDIEELVDHSPPLMRLLQERNYSRKDALEALAAIVTGGPIGGIKREEWRVLSEVGGPVGGVEDQFRARPLAITGSTLESWFRTITIVDTLREVTALRGFTRIEPLGRGGVTEQLLSPVQDFPSSTEDRLEPPERWLPGIELFGEGIFFAFRQDRLKGWAEVEASRIRDILRARRQPAFPVGVVNLEPSLVLIHTFAHLLIREISLSCGYSSAALRERLYIGTDEGTEMFGALIYTASPDSEGTLGGLVEQAKDCSVLSDHIRRMVEDAHTCSQDPLCWVHDPATTGNPWGASCHACCQLAETSCERVQNCFLDRRAIVELAKGSFA